MSDAGVPIEKIARLVGHSSTATTELVYRKQIRPVPQGGAEVTHMAKATVSRGLIGAGLVGVPGLEPGTSSLSGCRSGRSGSAKGRLTCGGLRSVPSGSPPFTPFAPGVLGPM